MRFRLPGDHGTLTALLLVQVRGTEYLVPRILYRVLATKYLSPSTWYQVLGAKYLVQVSCTNQLQEGLYLIFQGTTPALAFPVQALGFQIPTL